MEFDKQSIEWNKSGIKGDRGSFYAAVEQVAVEGRLRR